MGSGRVRRSGWWRFHSGRRWPDVDGCWWSRLSSSAVGFHGRLLDVNRGCRAWTASQRRVLDHVLALRREPARGSAISFERRGLLTDRYSFTATLCFLFSSSDWLKFWGSHGEMQAEERDRVCSLGKEKILQRLRGLETLEASSRARCSVAAVFAERFSFGLGAILSFSEAVRVKARTWRVFGAKKRFKKLRFLPLLCRIEAAIAVISVLFWRFLKLSLAPLKCSPWRDKLRTPKRGELESVGRQIQVSGATGGGWGFSPAVAHPSSLLIFYSAAKRESLSFPFPF